MVCTVRFMSTRLLWMAVLCGYFALGATIQALPALLGGRPRHDRPARDAGRRGDRGHAPVRRAAWRIAATRCEWPARARPWWRPARRRTSWPTGPAAVRAGPADDRRGRRSAVHRRPRLRPARRPRRCAAATGSATSASRCGAASRSAPSSPPTTSRAGALWLAATTAVAALALTAATPRRSGGPPAPPSRRHAAPLRPSFPGRRGGPGSCSGWRRSGTGRSTRSPCWRPGGRGARRVRGRVSRRAAARQPARRRSGAACRRRRVGRPRGRGARGGSRSGARRSCRWHSPGPPSRSSSPPSPCGSSRRAPERERGAAVGAMTSCWDVGIAAAGTVGALVVSPGDLGPAFGLAAALAVAAAIGAAPKRTRGFPDSGLARAQQDAAS